MPEARNVFGAWVKVGEEPRREIKSSEQVTELLVGWILEKKPVTWFLLVDDGNGNTHRIELSLSEIHNKSARVLVEDVWIADGD